MSEYLYRATIKDKYNITKHKPIYAVEESPNKVRIYIEQYLRSGYKINKIQCLGKRLAMNMFSGK